MIHPLSHIRLTCFIFVGHFRAGNKGFAYTFITKEQERFSGDIFRALDSSGVEVPSELETMWVRYRAKQAAVCFYSSYHFVHII